MTDLLQDGSTETAMTLTATHATLVAAGIAALSAVTVAVLSAFIARIYVGRDRRRQMYGEAFRAALEWQEMVYRVRRRENTKENDRVITDKFHELQERLAFYEGWIGSESKFMRRSFERLVTAAKEATQDEINAAWAKRGTTGSADANDHRPVIEQSATDGYLRDVRAHLSLQPWRWMGVAWRNRE